MIKRFEVEFSKDYDPTPADLNAIRHLIYAVSPNTETPPPERHEITGDIYESEPTIDTNKEKRENDEDKKSENSEPTKH